MVYRMKFEKHDEVKYIGHLDTMRTFTRCIKRTSLPIKFSKGFNPRVQLSFALPLGVGVTSDSEYVDLELEDEVDVIELKKELNETQEKFNKQEDALKEKMILSYEMGNTTYLDVLLNSKGILDFLSNYYLISEILSRIFNLI